MSSSKTEDAAKPKLRFVYIRDIGKSEVYQLDDSMRVFADAKRIRTKVFVEEQKCLYADEFDGFDFSGSTHIVAYAGKEAVAVCRIRKMLPFLKLERVAVLKEYRKFGYGKQILQYAMDMAQKDKAYTSLKLILLMHAQSYLVTWYRKFGFEIWGHEFEECGILHYVMILWPKLTKPFEFELLMINRPELDGFYQQSEPKRLETNHPEQIDRIRDTLVHRERPYILPNIIVQSQDLHKYFKGNQYLIMFKKLLKQFYDDEFILYENTGRLYRTLIDKLGCRIHAHYSTVDDRWRYFYTCVKIIEVMALYKKESYRDALSACDDALMKGGDLDDGSLSRCAHDIQEKHLPPAADIDFSKMKSREIPKALTNMKMLDIEILEEPSLDVFCNYVLGGRPAIIKGAVQHMPAFSKWSFEYLHKVLSHRKVPIEYGAYTSDSFLQKVRTFHEFLSELVDSEDPESGVQSGYLAQHRLFDQVPQLEGDIPTPDYCLCDVENELEVERNIFLGKGGSISPMHHDPRHNFFCQIVGRKFFRLVAPEFKNNIYLHDDIMSNNSSQVNLEDPDLNEFPLFKDVVIQDVLLEPGDALFVPKDYFHYVTAIDPSISVALWFGEGKVLRAKIEGALMQVRREASPASPPAPPVVEAMEVDEPKKTKRESYV